jgi:hypothetical protein
MGKLSQTQLSELVASTADSAVANYRDNVFTAKEAAKLIAENAFFFLGDQMPPSGDIIYGLVDFLQGYISLNRDKNPAKLAEEVASLARQFLNKDQVVIYFKL